MDTAVATGIISAASALIGVSLSQITALAKASREQTHYRKELLRNKYEELAACATGTLSWISSLSTDSEEQLKELRLALDARRAEVLAMLYFPDLKDVTSALYVACHRFYDALTKARKSRVEEKDTYVNDKAGLDQAAELVRDARHALDKKMMEHAEKYTRT